MQRDAIHHRVIEQGQQLIVDMFGFGGFARPVQIVNLDLDINHATGRHITAGAALQFVNEIDAVGAAEDTFAASLIERDYLVDMLQDRYRFFLDVVNVVFRIQ